MHKCFTGITLQNVTKCVVSVFLLDCLFIFLLERTHQPVVLVELQEVQQGCRPCLRVMGLKLNVSFCPVTKVFLAQWCSA